MRHGLIPCVIAALALAGCTGAHQISPEPAGHGGPTVTYHAAPGDLAEANARATSFCRRHNAMPRLVHADAGRATYACVSSTSGATPAPAVSPPAALGSAAVTFPVSGGDISAANLSAAHYCRQQGRTAQLLSLSGGSAYYHCR